MVYCLALRRQAGNWKGLIVSIDVIGNFLTILRNGSMAAKPSVFAPYSNIKFAIANILKEEGFIRDVTVETDDTGKKRIKVLLKYVRGESVIHQITRISKCGRRYYANVDGIAPVIGNLGVSILTTNKGIMTNKRAKSLSIGGEVICSVW